MFVGDFKIPPFRFEVDSFNNKTTIFRILTLNTIGV